MLNEFLWGVEGYSSPCIFLLGGFDGLHKGHKKLVEFAKSFSLPVGIMTMSGGKGKVLFTQAERQRIFEKNGISFAYALPFTEELKNTSPQQFIFDILKKFNVSAFVCGKDFRFGKDAVGSPEFIRLTTSVPTYDLDIVNVDGKKIGTRVIKGLLQEGNVTEAKTLLSYPFFLSGKVVQGRKVGRTIGFPTANIPYPKGKEWLKQGVYAVHTVIGGKRYAGICNVGGCPTFGVDEVKTETHFIDFDGELYGQTVTVFFDDYLRDIKKFDSADELKMQLQRDTFTCLQGFKEGNYD